MKLDKVEAGGDEVKKARRVKMSTWGRARIDHFSPADRSFLVAMRQKRGHIASLSKLLPQGCPAPSPPPVRSLAQAADNAGAGSPAVAAGAAHRSTDACLLEVSKG